MITLIKIRFKYLSNHRCTVFWSYFFIPIIILIFIPIFLILFYDSKKDKKSYEIKKYEGKALNITKELLSQNITLNKYNFSLVSKDEKDKKIIQELIKQEIEWQTELDKIQNKNHIIIKIDNINEIYKIELIQSSENQIFNNNSLYTDLYYDKFYPSYLDYYKKWNDIELFNEFFQLQSLFSQFLIKKKGNSYSHKELTIEIGENSYPPYNVYISDTFTFEISFVISIYFTMISYFFCMRMIEEKEQKLTELLERQGFSKEIYFFSWLLSYLFIIILPLIIYILFYLAFFRIHVLLFILNMILFLFSLFLFTFFLYTCISKSQTGSILIKYINFTSSILGACLMNLNYSKTQKIFAAFIPQINIYNCCFSINRLLSFKKISWEIIRLKSNKFSFMECIIMYLVEIIFYSLLLKIINKYKQSGLCFFQFLISCCKNFPRKINQKNENKNDEKICNFEKHFQDLSPLNKQKKEKNDCLSIANVTKYFDSLKSVDDFNGDFFGNEIFCLLGHNGAGKTTLINMISGILSPTGGDIFYKGKSLVTNKDHLFKNIGICQQEDIFFEYLTVSEHLEYMCEIKGSKANTEEIRILINKIGLEEKYNFLCSTLSGGQKRKLCIALALIGNSNIILLDEPTSGMDPVSKKALWKFLKNYQNDKITIIFKKKPKKQIHYFIKYLTFISIFYR